MRLFLFSILFLLYSTGFAQQKLIVSGSVLDRENGSPLIGATIYIFGTTSGSVSNNEGKYSLNIPAGEYLITAAYLGYKTDSTRITLTQNQTLNFRLTATSIHTEEVIVTTRNPESNIKSIETGKVELSMREIKKLPALMGEPDFLRIIQLTPGISAANDGNSGFYVRGGGADQNLVLLDNATIYNPNHVLGFFSVFNAKTIANTKLTKSGMPANYGGRLSSIVNVSSRDGDMNKYGINGSIGLLSSSLSIEGPIINEKLSFLVAGRRSYIDEVLKPIITATIPNSSSFYTNSNYYFSDINAKLSFKPNNKDKLSLSYYNGGDNYSVEQLQINFKNHLNWGNQMAAFNWSHRFKNNFTLLTTLSMTDYGFHLEAEQNTVEIGMFSGVRDYNAKLTLAKVGKKGSIVKTGIEHIYHQFQPNNIDASTHNQDLEFGSNRLLASHETSVFYNHEFDLAPNLRVNAGLRFTNYMHIGPYYEMIRDDIGDISDTTYYGNNEIIKTYQSLEPRLSLRYQLNKTSSIKGSYTQNNQYIHLVSSSTVTLPTDVWLPSTDLIQPQKGTQYTVGYFRNFFENKYITSINAYYKEFHNQIELLSGFLSNFQDNIFEESITIGSGNSYGIEVFAQKSVGDFTGWIGYTLSKTNRQFDEINDGKIYPAKYDRRHDINIVAAYTITERWDISGTFIYATGNALTLPEAKYVMENNVITEFGQTNAYRMPDYHRLDISANYLLKKTDKYESSINFSVFNIYNRANPFYIYFEITGDVENGTINITPKQITLFPMLPSITWSFQF